MHVTFVDYGEFQQEGTMNQLTVHKFLALPHDLIYLAFFIIVSKCTYCLLLGYQNPDLFVQYSIRKCPLCHVSLD